MENSGWSRRDTCIGGGFNNPYIVLDVIPGAGKITKRLNVSAMASNAGAVAAVNGDFFNIYGEGAPIGPMVVGGRTAASPSKIDGLYALGITQDRRAVIQSFSLWGKVISPSGMEFPISGLNKKLTGNRMVPTATMISSISMMICGEDLLGGTMDIQFPLRFWLKIVK